MTASHLARLGGASLAFAALAGLCALLGAPVSAALLAGGAGASAAWFGTRAPFVAVAPAPPVEARAAPPDADIASLIEAIAEPALFVRGTIVAYANSAARDLLGDHIVDEDVRVAIRHPAATASLTRGDPEAGPVLLVGIGARDRRWELLDRPVGSAGRLVRLVDRSAEEVAGRMRVDFVANASHELRTPLATLIGFIETLEDTEGPNDAPTRARFLAIMAREARRMQRLLDDLISLSRIEADKYVAPQTPLRLHTLAEEARAGQGEQAARVEIDADPETPAVAGDRAQLVQLASNLLGNAIKYGRVGTAVRVTIGPAPGGMARLTVADDGEGIAREHLPRLTERFYRVDAARSRSIGGTGLGLAIVKHIVERHRGRLDIASEVGRGTTITVLLPAAREQPPREEREAASSIRHTNVAERAARAH